MGVSSNWLGCVSDKDTMKVQDLLCLQWSLSEAVCSRIANTKMLTQSNGEVSEWFMVAVLKTAECHSSVGSNPTFSAKMDG